MVWWAALVCCLCGSCLWISLQTESPLPQHRLGHFAWKQERRGFSEGQIVHWIWGGQVMWLCTNPGVSAALSGGCQGDFTKSWLSQNLLMSQHRDPAALAWIFQLPGGLSLFRSFPMVSGWSRAAWTGCADCPTSLYSQITQWVVSV